MGGTIQYVYRDGSRLTPWMLHVIDRANVEFKARFGCELLVTSGIRTHQEQINIFLSKFRVQWAGSGPYGDVRWWQGKRYVRYGGGGTVAAPGTSNHEVQGSKAAVDLRDSGRDAGVATGGNARANWLRANATRLGLIPSGYGFGEPWHYDIPNIFNTPPAAPAGKPTPLPEPELPEEEDDDMYKPTVHFRTEGGAEWCLGHPEIGSDLAPGAKRTDGKVTIFRGYMVTTDPTIGTAWSRTHAKGSGGETSRTDRAGYIAIQKELSRVSGELA